MFDMKAGQIVSHWYFIYRTDDHLMRSNVASFEGHQFLLGDTIKAIAKTHKIADPDSIVLISWSQISCAQIKNYEAQFETVIAPILEIVKK